MRATKAKLLRKWANLKNPNVGTSYELKAPGRHMQMLLTGTRATYQQFKKVYKTLNEKERSLPNG